MHTGLDVTQINNALGAQQINNNNNNYEDEKNIVQSDIFSTFQVFKFCFNNNTLTKKKIASHFFVNQHEVTCILKELHKLSLIKQRRSGNGGYEMIWNYPKKLHLPSGWNVNELKLPPSKFQMLQENQKKLKRKQMEKKKTKEIEKQQQWLQKQKEIEKKKKKQKKKKKYINLKKRNVKKKKINLKKKKKKKKKKKR